MKKIFVKTYYMLILLSTILGSTKCFFDIYIAKKLGIYSSLAIKQSLNIYKDGISEFIIIIILFYIFKFTYETFINSYEMRSKARLKFKVYENFMKGSYEKLQYVEPGEVVTRLSSDFDNIIDTYYESLIIVFIGIISFSVYFIYLIRINILLTALVTLLSILPIIPSVVLSDKFKVNFKNYMHAEDNIKKHLNSTIDAYEFIKLNNLKDLFENKMKLLFGQISECALDFEKNTAKEGVFNKGIGNLIKYSIYALVGYFLYTKYIDINMAVQYFFIISQLMATSNSIYEKYKVFVRGKVSFDRIDEIFYEEECSGTEIINKINSIQFNNVCFGYDKESVIKNLNFKISDKDKVFLEGSNGSGKSTIVKLLLGVYDSYTGEILINGINIKNISKKTYRNRIALLTQNQLFFSEVLEDNLSLFNKNINKIKHLVDTFNMNEEVTGRTSCYTLSGGQKQKISLIRTLLKESDLIVLDEPTNYLDSAAIEVLESEIKKSDKTIIVISHLNELKGLFNKILNTDELRRETA